MAILDREPTIHRPQPLGETLSAFSYCLKYVNLESVRAAVRNENDEHSISNCHQVIARVKLFLGRSCVN